MSEIQIAYCWRSGEIAIGKSTPEGAIPLMVAGSEEKLLAALKGTARLCSDNMTFLVPGVPEAATDDNALEAVRAYTERLRARLAAIHMDRPKCRA